MIGLAMVLVAIAAIVVLNNVLEQRAEQPDDTYTPPDVPRQFQK
jgi:hypothetical protein